MTQLVHDNVTVNYANCPKCGTTCRTGPWPAAYGIETDEETLAIYGTYNQLLDEYAAKVGPAVRPLLEELAWKIIRQERYGDE